MLELSPGAEAEVKPVPELGMVEAWVDILVCSRGEVG
jgi:hypothetical protein